MTAREKHRDGHGRGARRDAEGPTPREVTDVRAGAAPVTGAGPQAATTLGLVDRAYLSVRVAFASVLAVFYVTGVVDFAGPDPVRARLLYLAGMALVAAVTLGVLIGRLGFRQPAGRVLWWAWPFDLAATAMLVWSAGVMQDPFYPWVLGLSLASAALMRRRDAWMVTALLAIVYLLAHVVGHAGMHDAASFAVLALKSTAIVFTGAVVASAAGRQAEREERLLRSQREIGHLNEQLSRSIADLAAVSEVTEIIHSSLDFDRVGPLVLDVLSKLIDLPAIALFVIDKDKDETLFSASVGVTPTVARGLSDAHLRGDAGMPDDTFGCMTLLDHQRLMVVFCAAQERIERIMEDDRVVLQAVASELVIAVENSQLYKLTKRLSITDELTGLYNYRYLQQRLDEEIERARRYGRSLSLLMVDADDFKSFNDTHGHIAGDQALSELGAVLRAAVREIDVACRYGGEEFAVVLPETDAEGAFVVAEKVREAVALHPFPDGAGNHEVRMTISIGLATYPATAADREELLRQADDALYQAKSTGRDRVRAPSGEIVRLDVDEAGR